MKIKQKSAAKNGGGFQALWLILAQGAILPILTLFAPRITFVPLVIALAFAFTFLHIASNKVSLIDSELSIDYENIIDNAFTKISLPSMSKEKTSKSITERQSPTKTTSAVYLTV